MNRNLKHNYRVTEREDVIIRKKAQTAQMKLSDYVRHSALEKQIVVISGIRELLPELNKVGSNLNQQTVIMRQNSGYCPHIDEMKDSFCGMMDKLADRLNGGDADRGN